ncbi:phosphopantothenoylcysteine synthase [Treponema sp. TIM-1]|uniref:phosphopantothenoylcysteine decarboxylase domain-containing protein n=1 Tax=Treponema sp. TIM-1 TaxID=2898417 RepID=UPI0039815804
MNFLVTAGGTVEQIDSVRSITNSATGRLGSLIADELAGREETAGIWYICGKTAARPQTPRAEILPIGDTATLEAEVRRVLAGRRIDGIIHTMAVSDYRVSALTTPRLMAESLLAARENSAGGLPDREGILRGIQQAPVLDRGGKIDSGEQKLILILEPTVKVISLFRGLAPKAVLVGFKLLHDVPHEALINTAYALLEKNHCDFVLANDDRDIHGDCHAAYLIDRDRRISPYGDKQSIARGIVSRVIAKIREQWGK